MFQENILIIGSSGQLGSVLVKKLQEMYGEAHVFAADLRENPNFNGQFLTLDATQYDAINTIVSKHKITQIYHLVAILSANGEKNPMQTWHINMNTLFNVLEVARLQKVKKVFFPSSIAVFGDHISTTNTPQFSYLQPETIYGMTKVAGEHWLNYYYQKYQLDVRSVRYPGVIGYQSLPGGGTTDYAVDIFYKAIKNETFNCFLNAETTLPMIYMDDAIRATLELMEAPSNNVKVRTSYNIAGLSFNPKMLAESIQQYYPQFNINYAPDYRQQIADSWPKSIDDTLARTDWNWSPKFNLEALTKDMLLNLKNTI